MDQSLAYNPQGGRIVLHTACDKEVATFAFGQEAQWRNGKDNRPHLYVEGNPVGFRDPSGNALSNSWLYAIGTYVIAKSQGMNDQQAMIYAASAYGVGRAKDRKKGDFWKHNDISRGITSAWSSYLRSDFGRVYKSLGRQLSDYIKNPIRSLERSDLARSDIGKGYSRLMKWTRSMGDQYLHYLQNPKYALENSDLAKSDLGRAGTHFWKHGCGALIFTILLSVSGVGKVIAASLTLVPEWLKYAYAASSGANDIASCASSSGGYYGYGGGSFGG